MKQKIHHLNNIQYPFVERALGQTFDIFVSDQFRCLQHRFDKYLIDLNLKKKYLPILWAAQPFPSLANPFFTGVGGGGCKDYLDNE